MSEPMCDPCLPKPWNWVQRGLFRFFFVYLLLYNIDVPLQYVSTVTMFAREKLTDTKREDMFRPESANDPEKPWAAKVLDPVLEGLTKVNEWETTFLNTAIPWVGKEVFDVEVKERRFTGSGDGLFSYLMAFTWAATALGVAALWSLLDWWSVSYRRLHYFLRVVVRFSLAYWMIVYGAMKVIKAQFPYPGLGRLMEPYGESSPMGLVWTFMGHSEGYNLFAGVAEMAGGLLLTSRRLTLFGALVSFGVMVHVTTLNVFYDVPVKLFSLHLVLMAMFLAAADTHRLVKFFFLNRPVEPAHHPAIFRRWLWAHYGVIAFRTFVVGVLVWAQVEGSAQSRQKYGDLRERPPLYGLYLVEDCVVDGKPVPLPTADKNRWLKMTIDSGFSRDPKNPPPIVATYFLPPQAAYFNDASNPRPDPNRITYTAKIDPEKRTVTLTKMRDLSWKAEFTYTQTEPDTTEAPPPEPGKPGPVRYKSGKLIWEGTMDGKKLKVVFQRVDDMYLLRRPEYTFRWIQEMPFNR